ncbi:MAG: hypothetical protein V7746_08155 [Halioglobus sp.]
MHEDLLIKRLQSMSWDDLKSISVGGLRLSESKIEKLPHSDLVLLCSTELRAAAGSSTRNLTRKAHDFPYKQLLIDVADKIAPGNTPLSWTKYRLKDEHEEGEIEKIILGHFDAQARNWWRKLSKKKRDEFVDGINSILCGDQASIQRGKTPYLQQQALEQLIQTGLIAGLSKASAGGILGVVGISVVGQLGWVILIQALGWMTGLKIAIFGIGGYGAMGGAVTWLGGAAIGSVVAIPGLVALVDGPAYRKTVPATIMLLAKTQLDRFDTAADK